MIVFRSLIQAFPKRLKIKLSTPSTYSFCNSNNNNWPKLPQGTQIVIRNFYQQEYIKLLVKGSRNVSSAGARSGAKLIENKIL